MSIPSAPGAATPSSPTPGSPTPASPARHRILRRAIATLLLTLAAAAAVLMLVWPNISWLRCDRLSTGSMGCQLRGFSLIGLPTRAQTIRPLIGAQLNLADLSQRGYVYRVMLATPEREIPLGFGAARYRYAADTLERIKQFMKNPQTKSLSLIYPLSLAPLALILGGIAVLAIAGGLLVQMP